MRKKESPLAKTRDILKAMADAPRIFDGAMGTEIYRRGVFLNACYDELCLTNAQLIANIHADYVDAGADVIETNSFGANRVKLRAFGLAEKAVEINAAAARLARDAAGETVCVVGSVGPCLANPQPLDETLRLELQSAFDEQVRALVAGGVDAILLETFACLAELQLAAEVAARCGLPVLASVAVDEEGRSAGGTSAALLAETLDADGHVSAVGLNCGCGPAGILKPLADVLARTRKPVIVMPNAGGPREVGGRKLYLNSPEYFTEYARKYVELGARGVGGCCGTGPEHIRLAARAIRTLSGVKKHVEVRAHAAARDVAVVPTAEKGALAHALAAGKKVASVEFLSPRTGAGMGKLLAKVRQVREAGVEAVNIPDGPRASARVSPMIAALTIERETGMEVILHCCCRDRNLIGMQSDLLGVAAAGLRNVLLVTGDPPKLGDYPDATGVFDVDSIGLTRLVSNLNHGFDAAGHPIDPPTALLAGVGANPCAVEMEREIDRYFAKLDAGAEFVITQPVFDPQALLRFLDRVEKHPRTVPVLAGVWPLLSFRNAEFMNNEVPGVVVPPAVLDRMAACRTGDDAKKTGVDIAREIMAAIAPRVQGFQVSAPLGNVEMALAVLAG
ncbi:MAG TPA: bifunctional homocysteine S-methyltransferase/methylenetetrahydrofolate reductase [Phycisphaerae bacterium]|nr:bifunctional homocysteine S-methyltransferase/methylenetetrahydrofolate reductase [Phycisphaerae bacterium]